MTVKCPGTVEVSFCLGRNIFVELSLDNIQASNDCGFKLSLFNIENLTFIYLCVFLSKQLAMRAVDQFNNSADLFSFAM